jgi:hypothetical protein
MFTIGDLHCLGACRGQNAVSLVASRSATGPVSTPLAAHDFDQSRVGPQFTLWPRAVAVVACSRDQRLQREEARTRWRWAG